MRNEFSFLAREIIIIIDLVNKVRQSFRSVFRLYVEMCEEIRLQRFTLNFFFCYELCTYF